MSFENLDVWKRSARLSADLYRELKGLRDYGFRDQITRAGLSVPSNIAEGFERASYKDCANFLSYAKGSCGELRTQIYVGMSVGYIDKPTATVWLKETREIGAMLSGLITLKRKESLEIKDKRLDKRQEARQKTQDTRRKTQE
ncbi:MAG: four helix bundle protein [Desulfuromonas sp.]|nr:four helix bundle protein [Desulfuromonas sp.]